MGSDHNGRGRLGSHPARVLRRLVARRREGAVAGSVGNCRFLLLAGCRGVEIHGHECTKTRRSGSGTSTIERAGCFCGTRRIGATNSCRWHLQ
jgi:hypothetical protein